MRGAKPHIFTIPAGTPFLPTLAAAVLAGQLGPIPGLAENPLALADVTILVPTRRAARALGETFAATAGGVTVLPRIRPIGDIDEEEQLLEPDEGDAFDRLALPPPMSRLERQLTLARMVLEWGRAVRRQVLLLREEEAQLIPASAGDAMRLAADLARLIDDMETAGIAWDRLRSLTPDDHAAYWTITLEFLKIAMEAWPAFLAERGLADPVKRRDALIRAEAERLRARPPAAPYIAAGSTGTIPATAELLKTIADLPNGAVVLPGLDLDLDEEGWSRIGTSAENPVPSHPQFGLKRLLSTLGATRSDVVSLASPAQPVRARLVGEAMRPAETTERWARESFDVAAADGVGLIVAANEQEEALAIALALREGIADGLARMALVTPERTLARRVSAELARYGLTVDDSAGLALRDTPPAVLARLVLDAGLSGADPVTLLALAKHPLAAFGVGRAQCRRAARALELALFRNPRLAGGVAELPARLAEMRHAAAEGGTQPARGRRRHPDWLWEAARGLADGMAAALAPLEGARKEKLSAAAAAGLLAAALERIADPEAFGNHAATERLLGILEDLRAPAADNVSLDIQEFPNLLLAALEGVRVPPEPGADPRIHIWGTLEARLQSADLIVIGGLDEGVWPSGTRTDPWLSRAMRARIGLDPPERRIGLSAHDFTQAMGAPRVLITRAEKRGGAPTVPSRWLQRLGALLGADSLSELRRRGEKYIALARAIDRPPGPPRPIARPEPKPSLDVRPRTLSVTEIETWVRDPYAIYARHILKLAPLEDIGAPPDVRHRGTLIHAVLGDFIAEWRGPFDSAAERRLLEIGRAAFASVAHFPEVHALWWLRFEAIARWFIGWEAARDAEVAARHAEVRGHMERAGAAGPFVLRGRADRIDLRRDGRIDIYDFKTGSPPSVKQVLTGLSPQLGLEAAMARAGAFDVALVEAGAERLAGRSVATLAWIGLSAVRKGDPEQSAVERGMTADAVGDATMERLAALIAAYDDPAKGYQSLARPMFQRQRFPGDYDHLARIAEWRLAEGEDDQ